MFIYLPLALSMIIILMKIFMYQNRGINWPPLF